MRIGIDARPMDTENMTGIGVYVSNLVENLAKIDRENEYILYFSSLRRKVADMPGPSKKNFAVKVIRLPYVSDSNIVSSLWMDLFLPRQLKRDRVDVFHSTYAYTPRQDGFRSVTTIHDLNFIVCKELSSSRHARHCQAIYKKAVARSGVLVAVSESTAKDMRDKFPEVSGKIKVVYSGRDERFKTIDDPRVKAAVKSEYRLPDRFILAIGSEKERKNTKALINSYTKFLERYGLDYKLVITGIRSLDHIDGLSLNDKVRSNMLPLGYVPLEKLVALYNLSSLFVYPSLYEGFGFPVLEAQACRTPVIASRVSALPEVIGDDALLFDPNNEDEISALMYKVLSDDKFKTACVNKGAETVKAFNWESTAVAMVNIYKEASKK